MKKIYLLTEIKAFRLVLGCLTEDRYKSVTEIAEELRNNNTPTDKTSIYRVLRLGIDAELICRKSIRLNRNAENRRYFNCRNNLLVYKRCELNENVSIT